MFSPIAIIAKIAIADHGVHVRERLENRDLEQEVLVPVSSFAQRIG